MSKVKKFLPEVSSLLFTLLLVNIFLHDKFRSFDLNVYRGMTPIMILENSMFVVMSLVGMRHLTKTFPLLGWSLFPSWLQASLMPAKAKYLGPICLVAIIVNIPCLAFIEEFIFRNMLTASYGMVIASILFGLTHCLLVGASIGAGLSATLTAFWFAHQYKIGGLVLSTLHHSAYNAVLFSIVVISLCKSFFTKQKEITL